MSTESMADAQALTLSELVAYQTESVVSRTLLKTQGGSLTVFSFDAGQSLSEHSAPFDAIVQVIDGEAELVIGGSPVKAPAGSVTKMPANIPHAVNARQRFTMLLTMLRD